MTGEVSKVKAISVCADCGGVSGAHKKDCPLLLSIFKAKSASRTRQVTGRG